MTATINETLLPILDSREPTKPARPIGLLEQLLDEQQQLTAVEQFSRSHSSDVPAQAKYYSRLLPATSPQEGQQFAFDVDLDRCSGCKACVTACHSMNGLDDEETFRSVGLLTGGTTSNPVMQHITTTCHHCLDPACMSACPVNAYEKDPVTGIVKHLDDQCFGCQYCTLACPYDVPQYNAAKGIVRKCDMCSDRLAVGEAPACVQACPHEAISINIVDTQQVREDAEADYFLPAAPDPLATLPTTRFKTERVFPRNTLPADYYAVNPQKPHWPLVVMLVLTQLSVGAFVTALLLDRWLGMSTSVSFRQFHATTSLAFGLLALVASTMHLGRPLYAFRAILGIRHSWLSREIIAFGGFAGSAVAFAAVCWMAPDSPLGPMLEQVVAIAGAIGVFSSVMIYAVTGREFWSFGLTAVKFTLTSALLGIAATWFSLLLFSVFVRDAAAQSSFQLAGPHLVRLLMVVAAAKLLLEASQFRYLFARRNSPLKQSARLLVGPLSSSALARFGCGFLGGVVMPMFVLAEPSGTEMSVLRLVPASMLLAACVVGEILERYQFFAACAAPRMPGGLRS